MMKSYTYSDDLLFGLADGGEHSLVVRIKYRVYPRREPTLEEPGEAASAEIETAEVMIEPGIWTALPEWMLGAFYSDATLLAHLLSEAADEDEYQREQAADARREEMRSSR